MHFLSFQKIFVFNMILSLHLFIIYSNLLNSVSSDYTIFSLKTCPSFFLLTFIRKSTVSFRPPSLIALLIIFPYNLLRCLYMFFILYPHKKSLCRLFARSIFSCKLFARSMLRILGNVRLFDSTIFPAFISRSIAISLASNFAILPSSLFTFILCALHSCC